MTEGAISRVPRGKGALQASSFRNEACSYRSRTSGAPLLQAVFDAVAGFGIRNPRGRYLRMALVRLLALDAFHRSFGAASDALIITTGPGSGAYHRTGSGSWQHLSYQ